MTDPMYRRIAEDLRQKIETGELAHGAQLPTELELREQYDASRNTVRDAVKSLITRGLVETRPGQGTFVVEMIDPFVTTLSAPETDGSGPLAGVSYASEVTALGRKPTTTMPRVEIQLATGVVASALRLNEGATVVSRHQQRFIDDTLWSLQTTFYPMRFVEAGAVRLIQAADIKEGVVVYLATELGIKQVGYSDKILVRSPDPNETAFFKLPDDGRVAVVEVLRTGFDENGDPLRFTTTVFPADRNQFVFNVGTTPATNDTDELKRPDPETKSFSGRPLGKDSLMSLA
jgi:GntR family transcriptional regulator